MPKTILFFVDDYSGGAGNVVQILANEFHKLGEIPVIAILNPHTKKYKLNEGIATIEYMMSKNTSKNKLVFLWRNLSTVRKIVKEVNPDVIVSFIDNINTNVCLSLFFKKRIPIIVSERSNPIAIQPYGLYRHLRPLAYRRANVITVQCEYFKNFMPNLKHKMVVTPNPVVKPAVTKESYLLGDKVKFVTCARLSTIKQLDKMIEAFNLIHRQIPNSQLTIFGEGPERHRLVLLIEQLSLNDSVFLPGATKNVFNELANSDIYLMTSKQEGFPNALCEAMSVGLPVVAFECHPGLRDIVECGKNGYLVSPDNINEFAQCTIMLLSDETLRKRIGQNAKKIVTKFSIKNVSIIWDNLFKHFFNQ